MQRSAAAKSQNSESPDKPQMGRPRSADVDRRIEKETLDVVSEKGFSGVTVNEICERAGVSRATFYRRYPSPAEALAAAINSAFEFHTPPLSDDPVEYLLEFARALERSYSDPRIAPAIGFLIGEYNAKPDVYERLQQGLRERRAYVRGALEAVGSLPEQSELPLDLDEVLVILSSLAWNAAVTKRRLEPVVLRTVIARLIR